MRIVRGTLLFGLFCMLFLFQPQDARAAVIAPAPVGGPVAPGATFTVPILLDSEGESVNVVSAEISYSVDSLELIAIDRSGSVLTLWAEEPQHNASRGRIAFAGGRPNGTVASNVPLVTLVFRARATGHAEITVESTSAVLLNDGAGTPATLRVQSAPVRIEQSSSILPIITSSTHPDEWRWYANRSVQVRWGTVPGAFYSYQISRDSAIEADEEAEPEAGFAQYPALVDGVWYFTLRERLPGEEWGMVQHRAFRVDATAPTLSPVTVEEVQQGKHIVSVVGEDATSGIQKTEARVLRTRFSWLPFGSSGTWETITGVLVLEDAARVSRIEIRAFDLAGNVVAARYTNPDLAFTQRLFLATLFGIALLIVLLFTASRMMRRKHRI